MDGKGVWESEKYFVRRREAREVKDSFGGYKMWKTFDVSEGIDEILSKADLK